MKKSFVEIYFTQPEEKHGRDPLGFTSLVMSKREELLPGITSTTFRAIYYLLCSLYKKLYDNGISKKNLAKYLDILLLKSNLNSNEHMLGRSKRALVKNKNMEKLSEIEKNWIETDFLDYYRGSFKKLFTTNPECPLNDKEIKIIKQCIKDNKAKPIQYLCVTNENKKIQDWLRENIFSERNPKLKKFRDFIKGVKRKDGQEREELVRWIFLNSIKGKNQEFLGDIPIIERFLWTYETIFNLLLELLRVKPSFDYNNIIKENFSKEDDKEFLENRNEKIEEDAEKKEDENLEEFGKDEAKSIVKPIETEKLKGLMSQILGYLEYLKKEYNDTFQYLKSRIGSWIAGNNICESILKHHANIKGDASFIGNKNGKWTVKRNRKSDELHLSPFPKHYYGIYPFLCIMEDLGF